MQAENKTFSLPLVVEEKKRPEKGRESIDKNPITGIKRIM